MESFDVIVVGGGLAGLSTAYTLAKAGVNVIVFERGEYPGAKNVSGCVMYRQPSEEVFPDMFSDAPYERPVLEQSYWFTTKEAATKFAYRSEKFGQKPYNNFTVLRAKLDRFLGRKVEDVGALVVCETNVDEIIKEEGKVVGVKVSRPEGEVRAKVVVVAEGVNSMLAQEALGLKNRHKWGDLAVAAKEVIALPKEKIEDRFCLSKGMGATIELFGDVTKGMVGTGFIYTNYESISIGVGALMSQMVNSKINPNDLLEHMKSHPMVAKIIEGGEVLEYAAHLIPEGGYHSLPKLYDSGVLIVGDAAMLVNGLHREGTNLAMISGKLAAETIMEALRLDDFGAQTLKQYEKRLSETFVIKDLQKYANTSEFFENNSQFFNEYPEMMSQAFYEFFNIDMVSKKEKQKIILGKTFQQRSKWNIMKDLLRAWRVLG